MCVRFLIAALLTLAALTRPARTDAAEPLTAATERLFAIGAEPSAKALRGVRSHYGSLPDAVRSASSVKYAYAVVLIRQKRLLEAGSLLDQLAASRPEDLRVCRARIWIQLTLGERAKALETLGQLQEQLAFQSASDRDPVDLDQTADSETADSETAGSETAGSETAGSETAEFLGALSGFFAGPWHSRQREGEAEKLREELRAPFEGDSRAAFDHGEAQVLARYLQLHRELQQASQIARKVATKRTDRARADLLKAETSLVDEEQSLNDKDANRSNEAKAKLVEIDAKLEKLGRQQGAIVLQMAPLEQAREALVVQFLPEPPPGPWSRIRDRGAAGAQANIVTFANIRHNDGLRRLLAPIVSQLTLLMGQAAQIQDSVQELEAERYSVVGRRQQDSAKIDGKKQELDRREARLTRASKRLNAAGSGNTVQVRAQATRMSLFSTYLEFPFEREKQRVLSLLAKP